MKLAIAFLLPICMVAQPIDKNYEIRLKPFFGFSSCRSTAKVDYSNASSVNVTSKRMFSYIFGLSAEAQYKRLVVNVGLMRFEPGIKMVITGLYAPTSPSLDFNMQYSKPTLGSLATVGINFNKGLFFLRPESGIIILSRLEMNSYSTITGGTNVSSFEIENEAKNTRDYSFLVPIKLVAGRHIKLKNQKMCAGVELAYFYSWQNVLTLNSKVTTGNDIYFFSASTNASSEVAKLFLSFSIK